MFSSSKSKSGYTTPEPDLEAASDTGGQEGSKSKSNTNVQFIGINMNNVKFVKLVEVDRHGQRLWSAVSKVHDSLVQLQSHVNVKGPGPGPVKRIIMGGGGIGLNSTSPKVGVGVGVVGCKRTKLDVPGACIPCPVSSPSKTSTPRTMLSPCPSLGSPRQAQSRQSMVQEVGIGSTGSGDEITMKFKLSQFKKTTFGPNHSLEYYVSPSNKFMGLLWYFVILPPVLDDKVSVNGKNSGLVRCRLSVMRPTTTSKSGTGAYTGTGSDDLELDIPPTFVTITNSYHCKAFGEEVVAKQVKLPGQIFNTKVDLGKRIEVLSWWEDEMIGLFPMDPLAVQPEDYLSVHIVVLTKGDAAGDFKYFKKQQLLLAQMEQDAQVFFSRNSKLALGFGTFKGTNCIQTTNGPPIEINEEVLIARGGTLSKLELHKLQLRWEHQIMFGFREYLYTGKVPNLSSGAIGYFHLAKCFGLDQIQELAELELCKWISLGGKSLEDAHEIAKKYGTKFLQSEIKDFLKSNPNIVDMDKTVEDHFDSLRFKNA